ncbi:hypothetical protein QA644_14100 [Rhizobium sp. CC1099]|uniref:hypothetical protein n=1 Tax=Rhizobium sp. CC1099 TaxID=3039160 RepID=UPI0024B0FEF1|nr:hypothetical protein [Rhizobium sp. CC1099]WFU86270.1 hypothetical protein QA644_14100 [Rhizobium sp. CC1099]
MGVKGIGFAFMIGAAALAPANALDRPKADDVFNPESADEKFAETVHRWNGAFLWEPASASTKITTRLGDEARAVFGPIPDADCGGGGAKTIPLEVDGNIVDLQPNPDKAGNPLEFEHRDADGAVVKWTSSIAKCDKPSLAGNVTYCGLNSRLNRVVKGNVEWLFLCRKSNASLELEPDPYWQRSNPKFSRFGSIGFNRATGEIVFFDGRKDQEVFDWSKPFVPPGGGSYSDTAGRAAAEALYDPTFQIQCSACHDNKNPYVINPHIGQARVGYPDGKNDPRARAFSLGAYLPRLPRDERTPFRVIGSGYTSTYAAELKNASTVRDPNGDCTECHTLTTQTTGKRLAPDAVGREPYISNPSWAQLLELRAEKENFRQVDMHRTEWARRSGGGRIHPWMVPANGNDVSGHSSQISLDAWRELSDCLWGGGGPECGYRPLYTPCPAPAKRAGGDGSAPGDLAVTVLPPDPDAPAERRIRVSWKYLNSYGEVPGRDDVRFNMAVRESLIPAAGEEPHAKDYPSLDEAMGKDFRALRKKVGLSGSARLMQNASYFGHAQYSEASSSMERREYRLDFPGTCNRRYAIRILPKRFCFDQSDVAFGFEDYLLLADVRCD